MTDCTKKKAAQRSQILRDVTQGLNIHLIVGNEFYS